jgi:hypothetical protein
VVSITSKRPFNWTSWAIWLILAIVIGVSAYLIGQRHRPATLVWTLANDLPAYHLIIDSDTAKTTIALSDLPIDTFPVAQSVTGYYTRQPVKAGQVLQRDSLVISPDPTLTSGTVPVSILANAANAFNGQLSPGTVTTIWSIDPDHGKTSVVLQRALVIDVQKVENPSKSEALSYVVVIAVPDNKQVDILAAAASNSVVITLAP